MSMASIKTFLTLVAVTSAMTSTAALASEAKRAPAGQSSDGAAIEAVTLTNKAGLSARVLTYGATLQAVMAPDRDGKLADVLLGYDKAHAPNTPGDGPRWPLNIGLSEDGVHWRNALTLEARPMPDGYAYPAVIQTRDGLVHVTYTWNRQHIRHVVIDPSLLR